MTVRKMKWNDTAEGRNLEVKRDQKRTSERKPPILGGGDDVYYIIEVFINKQAKGKIFK